MSKKHFIALADAIREHNSIRWADNRNRQFCPEQIEALASFCKSQNPQFNWERWTSYIAGECGPNGGQGKQ